MEDVLVPLFGCMMIFGIVAVSVWASAQNKKEFNETVRRAIDAGQKLDADTISSLGKPVRSAAQDLRGGVVLTFLAFGLIVAGGLAGGIFGYKGWGGGDESSAGFYVAAAIVGAIGIGQLVAGLMRREKRET